MKQKLKMRRRFPAICLGSCVIALVLSHPSGAEPVVAPGVNGAKGEHFDVKVERVLGNKLPGREIAYDVAYQYSFDDRDSVFIQGLGLVPASGSFRYTASTPELKFLSARDGSPILEVALAQTDIVMGSEENDFVDTSHLAGSYRTGTWRPAKSFPGAAQKLIQQYYRGGYKPSSNGMMMQYPTTFRALGVGDPQVRADIGLLIEFADSMGAARPRLRDDELMFNVKYEIRERPRLSTAIRYNSDVNPATRSAAESFIEEVMKALSQPGSTAR